MNEVCRKSEKFLAELLADLKMDLRVSAAMNAEGCVLNIVGEDTSILLAEGGEMLDAFETILFQIYGRELEKTERFVCDADGFRRTRKAELQAMARFAANSVRNTGKPFVFGQLNSTERRLIHMTLAEDADLETASVGDGRNRQLQVKLK